MKKKSKIQKTQTFPQAEFFEEVDSLALESILVTFPPPVQFHDSFSFSQTIKRRGERGKSILLQQLPPGKKGGGESFTYTYICKKEKVRLPARIQELFLSGR